MGKSRTPRKSPPRRSGSKRARTRLRRPETLFAIFAVLTVVSLIVAAIGTTIVDELTQAGDNDTLEVTDDDVDAYEQSLRDAADANPDDPAALKELASYLSTTGQLSEAIGWYEKALALNPNDVIGPCPQGTLSVCLLQGLLRWRLCQETRFFSQARQRQKFQARHVKERGVS